MECVDSECESNLIPSSKRQKINKKINGNQYVSNSYQEYTYV